MNNQKTSKNTLIATAACVFSALITVLSLFMPVVKLWGDSITLLEASEMSKAFGDSGDVKSVLVMMVVICSISVIWALIPKMWSAIVGTIYSILPMALCVSQVSDWASNDYFDLAIGAVLMALFSVVVFVLSIAKIIFTVKDKKNYKNSLEQPQVPVM